MDFKNLAERLGLDEEDFMELVELFVDTSMGDIEKIKKGVEESSCPDAAAASHSIKGAAANMGFDEIAAQAEAMEKQAKGGSIEGFDVFVVELEKKVKSLADPFSS